MDRHFSQKFWHYGYENETELHVFVHGAVYSHYNERNKNIYGIFFGYADKRNEWGEVGGSSNLERAQLGAMTRAIDLVKNDSRILYVHTTNVFVVDRLEEWIPHWKKTKFEGRLADHYPNIDLIDSLTVLLKSRKTDVFFESIYQPSKVPGCALAIGLAIDGTKTQESLPLAPFQVLDQIKNNSSEDNDADAYELNTRAATYSLLAN